MRTFCRGARGNVQLLELPLPGVLRTANVNANAVEINSQSTCGGVVIIVVECCALGGLINLSRLWHTSRHQCQNPTIDFGL